MRRACLIGILLVCAAVGTSQQGPQILENVIYPLHDEAGRKEGEIRGRKVIDSGKGLIHVEGLVWKSYGGFDSEKEDAAPMTITTEKCRYNARAGVISSYGDIRIERGGLIITGTGYICDVKRRKFAIVSESRVVIKDQELWSGTSSKKKP